MGGVETAQDVLDMLACGARHVALGTTLFSDPYAPSRIREELAVVNLDDVFAAAVFVA
jgi:dihydroorotate dehydrogenase (NAD+) catalytic subunit